MAEKKRKETSMENSCTASTATKRKKMMAAAALAAAEAENKKDWLRDLPDDILYHIISFLPSTKLQVRTSILSKRWRHLWTHSPTLLFPVDNETIWDSSDQYERSIDRYLHLCRAPVVRRLKLYIKHESTPSSERWLDFAASRSIQELDLEFDRRYNIYSDNEYFHLLPRSLLRCENLTILCMENCHLNLPGLSFPHLNSLTLTYVKFTMEMLNELLSSSPLLQTLELSNTRLIPTSPGQCLLITHHVTPRLNKLSVSNIDCILDVDSLHIRSFSFMGHYSNFRRPPPFVLLTHLCLRFTRIPINSLPPSLPSLRSLTLSSIKIPQLTLNRLLSASPLLQTLELSKLNLQHKESIELLPEGNIKETETGLLISHPRLENLTLRDIFNSGPLEVASPNLRTFRFAGLFVHLSLAHTPHLHLAELSDNSCSEGILSVSRRNQIFSAISEVKILYIKSGPIYWRKKRLDGPMKLNQLLTANPSYKLKNLKELNYLFLSRDAFMFVRLLSVLAECPCIENLCIEFCIGSLPRTVDEKAMTKWLEVYQNPPLETLNRFELKMEKLKTIQLIRLPYSKYAMVFLDFLLQMALALETLVIDPFKYHTRGKRNRQLDNWICSVASRGLEVQIQDLEQDSD